MKFRKIQYIFDTASRIFVKLHINIFMEKVHGKSKVQKRHL